MARRRAPLKVESLTHEAVGMAARGVVGTGAARLEGIQPLVCGSWARR